VSSEASSTESYEEEGTDVTPDTSGSRDAPLMPPYDSPSYPESPPNASSSDSPFNASRKDRVSTAKLLLSPVHWTLGEIVITWISKKMNQSGILLLICDAVDDDGDGGCLIFTVDVMVAGR